jgi:microcystin-dependent protein
MAEPFIGQIMMVGFNFAPRGWALCDGTILSIAQNTALFSLLGTTYGGNGQTTFALPDLRGRVPVHQGAGPGLSPYTLGEQGGSENVTLTIQTLPAHNHPATAAVNTTTTRADQQSPVNNFIAGSTGPNFVARSDGTSTMNANATTVTVQPNGGSQPHENRQPYLCVNFIIALEGIFPSRN